MKEPETKSSDATANPGKDDRKKAASGPVIDSRPVSSGGSAGAATPEPKPQVESTLVGDGSGPGAAAAKSPAAGAPAAESAAPAKPAETAKPAPATPPSAAKPAAEKPETRVVEVRRGGFAPTFLGGVVAAGLGAAGAWWAIPHLPPAWQPGVAEAPVSEAQLEAARSAATEAATAAARSEVAAQADTFASRAAEAGADAARQALAGAGEGEKALADKLAALAKTVAEIGARPVAAPIVSGENSEGLQSVLNELTARLSAQQQRLDELSARPAVDPGAEQRMQEFAAQAEAVQQQVTAAADEAKQRLAAAEAQAQSLADSAESANRRAQAATAAAALQAALKSGGARDQALAALAAAGVEPPAALTGDVPTLDQLRGDFPAANREALAAALKAAPETGVMDRLGNFLRVQTGARSVEPREGEDADAVLSRANAALDLGNVQGALDQIATLPPAAQEAMSAWTARARSWVDANAALAALAAGSM
ncbi:hypothetical protein [Paracoccus sp. (in: a-proteobacteria)]|uniref:COG4223 family protein n=1 Tax=Paracoccus sp. TaxID=267 RepID=UPI0032207CBD